MQPKTKLELAEKLETIAVQLSDVAQHPDLPDDLATEAAEIAQSVINLFKKIRKLQDNR